MKNTRILITEEFKDGSSKVTFAPYDAESKTVYLEVTHTKIQYTNLYCNGMERLPQENTLKKEHTLPGGTVVTPDFTMEITPIFYKKQKITTREGFDIAKILIEELKEINWRRTTLKSGGYTIVGRPWKSSKQIVVKKTHPDEEIIVEEKEGRKVTITQTVPAAEIVNTIRAYNAR